MPKYIVTTTATATISERWEVEAPTPEAARNVFENGDSENFKFLDDKVDGDEENREVVSVEVTN